MKPEIHPDYHRIFVDSATGWDQPLDRTSKETREVDGGSACGPPRDLFVSHPFWTGKMRLDADGRSTARKLRRQEVVALRDDCTEGRHHQGPSFSSGTRAMLRALPGGAAMCARLALAFVLALTSRARSLHDASVRGRMVLRSGLLRATTRPARPCAHRDPLRQAFFGDLHVHEVLDDARSRGMLSSPDDARFCAGGRSDSVLRRRRRRRTHATSSRPWTSPRSPTTPSGSARWTPARPRAPTPTTRRLSWLPGRMPIKPPLPGLKMGGK